MSKLHKNSKINNSGRSLLSISMRKLRTQLNFFKINTGIMNVLKVKSTLRMIIILISILLLIPLLDLRRTCKSFLSFFSAGNASKEKSKRVPKENWSSYPASPSQNTGQINLGGNTREISFPQISQINQIPQVINLTPSNVNTTANAASIAADPNFNTL